MEDLKKASVEELEKKAEEIRKILMAEAYTSHDNLHLEYTTMRVGIECCFYIK